MKNETDRRQRPYNRRAAVTYARTWANARNPAYSNFDNMGGDCTNFGSQCIYAGSGVMNYTPTLGWYYTDLNNRAPAWSGVEFLRNFLVRNTGPGPGPVGEECDASQVQPGDIVQLSFDGAEFAHTLVICATGKIPTPYNIRICTHTADAYMRPLYTYTWKDIRYLHITKVNL